MCDSVLRKSTGVIAEDAAGLIAQVAPANRRAVGDLLVREIAAALAAVCNPAAAVVTFPANHSGLPAGEYDALCWGLRRLARRFARILPPCPALRLELLAYLNYAVERRLGQIDADAGSP